MQEPTQESTAAAMQTALETQATAAVNAPKKKLTLHEWKELMRVHFTVRRSIVKTCKHKLDPKNDPRNNCESCWFAYFNTNGETTQIADECFQNEGRDVLERIRGKKFVKYFLMFMSTIARFKAEYEKEKREREGKQSDSTSPSGDRAIGGIPESGGIPNGDSGPENNERTVSGPEDSGRGTEQGVQDNPFISEAGEPSGEADTIDSLGTSNIR